MSSVIEEYYNLKRQLELTPDEMELFENKGYIMTEKDKKFKQIAEWGVKYQKLSYKQALNFAPEGIPESSLHLYWYEIRKYILKGKIPNRATGLMKFIDNAIRDVTVETDITEDLRTENEKLKEKIKELEAGYRIDFSEVKQRIEAEIERLKNQLEAIETVEGLVALHQTE